MSGSIRLIWRGRKLGVFVAVLTIGLGIRALLTAESGPQAGASSKRAAALVAAPGAAYAAPSPDLSRPLGEDLAELARGKPLEFTRRALERYRHSVHDYTCLMSKQEVIHGHDTGEQQMRVKFRGQPFSVLMHWVRNPGKARRALYVANRWTNDEGAPLAYIEPQGPIARLFVTSVMRPIHGPEAAKSSRKSIDQFGFASSLRLILKYCDLAIERRHEMSYRFVTEDKFDGRETYVFERRLPYTGVDGEYPDRVLVVHIDKEWLVPTSCVAWADDEQTQLLGRYQCTDIQFNIGLADADFDPEANGF